MQPDVSELLLIDLWQAIELVGSVRERAGPVGHPGFLPRITNAEISLVAAISELMQSRGAISAKPRSGERLPASRQKIIRDGEFN